MLDNPQWIGRVEGLALAIRGTIVEPVRIRGVTVRPHDAAEIAKERFREWFAFEGWTGTSINTITGGADLQDLPLPLLLAAAVGLAALIVAACAAGGRRCSRSASSDRSPCSCSPPGCCSTCAGRGTSRGRCESTAAALRLPRLRRAPRGGRGRALYAFIEKVREVLPKEPTRVFVVADSHYFRGRAAYHLSPHRVFFDPRANTIPGPEPLRPGDWFLVYQRKGVQFDPSQGKLRWNNLPPVAAELKLATRGAALFQIR